MSTAGRRRSSWHRVSTSSAGASAAVTQRAATASLHAGRASPTRRWPALNLGQRHRVVYVKFALHRGGHSRFRQQVLDSEPDRVDFLIGDRLVVEVDSREFIRSETRPRSAMPSSDVADIACSDSVLAGGSWSCRRDGRDPSGASTAATTAERCCAGTARRFRSSVAAGKLLVTDSGSCTTAAILAEQHGGRRPGRSGAPPFDSLRTCRRLRTHSDRSSSRS